MYAKRNEAQLPLDIIQIHHGQDPLVGGCSSYQRLLSKDLNLNDARLASE